MITLAVIPARYGSTRLAAKPLADILGKPMIQWVWEAANRAANIDRVVIATDDERIKNAAEIFGAEVVLTSPDCKSGTDRVREVGKLIKADLYLNIQGDEPLVQTADLERLVKVMAEDDTAQAGTLYASITEKEALDPNLVKVVMTHSGNALYFSRSIIPFPRDREKAKYYGHLGIYAYRPDILDKFTDLPPSSLEDAEKLEQLRLLQCGIGIRCALARKMTIGVDTSADLEAVRHILACEQGKGLDWGKIRLVITDVDGVLTDGRLYYNENGECMKSFCARDGLGMIRARDAGLKIAILSGRDSPALRARISEMGIDLFETGNLAKARACQKLIKEAGVTAQETLFLGDDLPDREAFSCCAIGVAPADAEASTRQSADMVTSARGGEGVLREVIEKILAAKEEKA